MATYTLAVNLKLSIRDRRVTDLPQTMIEKALATLAQHEADQAVLGGVVSAPSLPLAQSLVLAIYMHERRWRRRASSGDARPEQLIKAARDAQIPEREIQTAIELAGRHATETDESLAR
jgi:hypothetical protein